MRVLVVGGTSFVGRHIAAALQAAGHELTLFNRGRTDPAAFPEAEHLVGDRDKDLSALAGRAFDATVDVCGFVPRQVRDLLDVLGPGAGHYTFISTISVYGQDVPERGFTETASLLEPAWNDERTMDLYGELKVGCELVAHELAGDRLLVVRPGYVVGPHDATHRFTYWVERVAAGGTILGPSAEQPLQCIDGRDLGAFVAGLVRTEATGAFNAAAPDPAPTFREVLDTVARGVGVPAPDVRWTEARDELPLSAPPDWWAKMRADVSKARAHGLTWRPLEDTARDTLAWVRDARVRGDYQQRPGVGLDPDDERAALAAL